VVLVDDLGQGPGKVDFAQDPEARLGVDLPPMAPGDIFTEDFHVQLPEL
jgi:hypothetical protein